MGEAKRRGTHAQRRQEAIDASRPVRAGLAKSIAAGVSIISAMVGSMPWIRRQKRKHTART